MDTCSDSVHVVEHRLRHCLCISCGHPHRSQPGIRVRCAACGWRYRPERLEREPKILRYFCLEISVYRVARELRMSFPPIWRRFMAYRRWMATVAEAEAQPLCGNFGTVSIKWS
jgi:hypothetical protein